MSVVCISARKCKNTGCPHHIHHEAYFTCLGSCIHHELVRGSICIEVKEI